MQTRNTFSSAVRLLDPTLKMQTSYGNKRFAAAANIIAPNLRFIV